MEISVGNVSSIEELIDQIVDNKSVKELCEEVEKIIRGEEPVKELLAFVPVIARIAYGIIEKDGSRGAEIEQIFKVIIGLIESKMVNND